MIHTLLLALASVAIGNHKLPPVTGLDPVSFTNVRVQDRFWSMRQQVNQKVSAIHELDELVKTGDLGNFQLAAEGKTTGRKGYVFQDSDVYKVIEGAADTLSNHPDPELDKRLDNIISLISKAQMPDGYLNTYYQVTEPGQRFTNLRDNHELYCAGHLMEAAVAHYAATGKKSLLNVAVKFADLLDKRYGPESGRLGYGGHPELELALVKLSHATHEHRYFALAEKLIKTRGSHFFAKEHDTPEQDYDGTYWIDDVPITEHREIKGHAVRAAYLMSGATDVVRENPDPAIEKMLGRVWNNVINKRIFVTGGIGPSGSNEGFTVDYDLPNLSAYQETCASIAMAMWGYRMGMLKGDGKYFDAVENALYNGMLAGVSLKGDQFFYVNPLASRGTHHRQAWFDCACCPPNVLRTVSTIGGYAYATKGSDLYVNLYLPGSADIALPNQKVHLIVKGDYPWNGHLQIQPEVTKSAAFGLKLRVPGWCSSAQLAVNGKQVSLPVRDHGYLVVNRTWAKGDTVDLNLDMPVDRVAANPQVKEDIGRLAVRRGPLVYCAEGIDQTVPVDNIVLPIDAKLKAKWRSDILTGLVEVEGIGEKVADQDWNHRLYQAASKPEPVAVRMIPYCYWDNRKASPMEIWLPSTPPNPKTGGLEAQAKLTASYISGNSQPEGINDGIEPKSSGEQPNRLMHFWPHKGTDEWVAYTWKSPVAIKGIKVYWFDDTGRGECRLPDSWRLEQLIGDQWVAVDAKAFPVEKDKWCEVNFDTIKTTSLRLSIKMKSGWAAGVRQWKIVEDED